LIIYPIRGNYTIFSIKLLVSNEISFSSIKVHVRLNINIVKLKIFIKCIVIKFIVMKFMVIKFVTKFIVLNL